MEKLKGLLFLMAILVPVVSYSASDTSHDMDKMLLEMESHWKQVIAEKDLSKRQSMMKDHANMMMDIRAINKDIPEAKRTESHHSSGNVLEIHHMMMETMTK